MSEVRTLNSNVTAVPMSTAGSAGPHLQSSQPDPSLSPASGELAQGILGGGQPQVQAIPSPLPSGSVVVTTEVFQMMLRAMANSMMAPAQPAVAPPVIAQAAPVAALVDAFAALPAQMAAPACPTLEEPTFSALMIFEERLAEYRKRHTQVRLPPLRSLLADSVIARLERLGHEANTDEGVTRALHETLRFAETFESATYLKTITLSGDASSSLEAAVDAHYARFKRAAEALELPLSGCTKVYLNSIKGHLASLISAERPFLEARTLQEANE